MCENAHSYHTEMVINLCCTAKIGGGIIMIWYKESSIPETKNFVVKRELLAEFKLFCKEEFTNTKKDIYDDLEKKVERNIFLKDFEQKDKEYLKMVLGLVRSRQKEYTNDVIEEIISSETLSYPPVIIIGHNEANFFVLKKACEYISLVKPELHNYSSLEILNDIKCVMTDSFFMSAEFRDQVNYTREKIRKMLNIFAYIQREDQELEMSILIKPLLNTDLVLKIPPKRVDLFKELVNQEIIHPSMKLPEGASMNSNILLEHLMSLPLNNTKWFVQQSILEGDSWIDYEKMYDYYNNVFEQVYKKRNEANFKDIKNTFEENLSFIRTKYLYNKMKNNNPQEDLEDYENEDTDFKL